MFLFLQGQNLIIGNLGDSRAVLGTRDEDNHLIAVQLTVDLKPSIPSMIHLHLVCYFGSYYMMMNFFFHCLVLHNSYLYVS